MCCLLPVSHEHRLAYQDVLRGKTRSIFDMTVSDVGDIKTVVISVVIITNITLNLLVVAVIARYPLLRVDRTALFMLSLTLSDLANGLTAMPLSAAVCSQATPNVRNMTEYLPKIHAYFSPWFGITSMHSLSWMTVYKMVAITNPLRCEQLLTRRRCYLLICSLWLTGAVLGATLVPTATSWNQDDCGFKIDVSKGTVSVFIIDAIVGIVWPSVAIIYSTTRIFFAILRTHRQISAQLNSVGGEITGTIPSLNLNSIRSGRNVLIVCFTFVVLTTPFALYFVFVAFGVDNYLPLSFRFISVWLFFFNSSASSLIYLVVFRSVRGRTSHMLQNAYRVCTFR